MPLKRIPGVEVYRNPAGSAFYLKEIEGYPNKKKPSTSGSPSTPLSTGIQWMKGRNRQRNKKARMRKKE